jgi:hypothetical protein
MARLIAEPIEYRLSILAGERILVGKVDAFLKFSVAVSLLLAAGSVGYYYSIYLPARDSQLDRDRKIETARSEYSKQAEQARLAAEKREGEELQAAAREAVQVRYRTCVRTAENNYNYAWAQTCKRISDQAVKNRKDCLSQQVNTKVTCDLLYPDRAPTTECTSLPRALATDMGDELDKTRKRCLEESQAGLQ